MIDIDQLRKDPEPFRSSLKKRGGDVSILDKALEVDKTWRELLAEIEGLRSEQKKLGKDDIEKARGIKADVAEKDKDLKKKAEEREILLNKIPNLLHPDVAEGRDESENTEVRKIGEPTKFNFEPKDHVELGEKLGLIDTETAAKVSGARFTYLMGDLALMQFALIQFTVDTLTNPTIIRKIAKKAGVSEKTFQMVLPPMMIRSDVFRRMARLSEEDKTDRYKIETDDLYLIGSAEHTLAPMHMDEVLDEKDLPIRYLGYSTSFRREAGSYGKDTKGILRLHQFDKLEMESFTLPENSEKEQEFIVAIQEYLVQKLGIPYRVVQMCSGDIGNSDYRQIDIECWMPGQNKYRETHTSDLMTDYQTRGMNTKVKTKDGKVFAHTNDATALAIGRTLIAIMENYQTKEGIIKIPKVLQKYLKLKEIS